MYNGWTKSQSDAESQRVAGDHMNTLIRLLGASRAAEYALQYLRPHMTHLEEACALGRAVNRLPELLYFDCPDKDVAYWLHVTTVNLRWDIDHADNPEHAARLMAESVK